ncbi:MAG: PEP-utilizing enzyme [Patescibacteria group bacterium]|nr:PEP-utilizing enzyme [Patescibacteria group bacterium]
MRFSYIWQKRTYPPILMKPVVEATVIGFKKIFPKSKIKAGGNYWREALGDYFFDDSGLKKTVEDLAGRALSNPAFLYNIFVKAFEKSKKLETFSEKNFPSGLKKAKYDELLKFCQDYYPRFYDFYSYGSCQSFFGYYEDNPIYQKMNEILKKKTRTRPENFADYLIILTNPPKKLETNQQEIAVLELAEKIRKRKVASRQEVLKKFRPELKALNKRFNYLSFDFTSKTDWDINHYLKLALEKAKSNFDIRGKIKELKNYERETEKKFRKVCRDIKLDKKEIKVFDLVRNLGYYKWAREYGFQKSTRNFYLVLEEMGRRLGLNVLEAKYVFLDEWEKYKSRGEELKKIARARIKSSLIFISQEKGVEILVGEKAIKKFKKLPFVKERKKRASAEIKGMPARAGKAEGVVKIINSKKDLPKMAKGNILVSRATNPELISAMKKAAAIITDEGGITCHAAIVSRELGIPCVVGTKIGTKALKDGDLVKVDANEGIVKKLSS